MRQGEVVRIRVNPRDCMSVVDVVKEIGFNYTGMSFSQACAIALSSLLASMREIGKIPTRQGFEYNDIMESFRVRKRTSRKLSIAEAIATAGDEKQIKPLIEDPKRAARKIRYEELKFKKETDPLNWTEELWAEFRPLVDEFFEF